MAHLRDKGIDFVPLWVTSHFDAISTQLCSVGVDSHRDLDASASVTALSGYMVIMQSDERKVC